MHATTNAAMVWKQMADENEQSARILARICAGLFAISIGAGIYAYSAHVRYSTLCSSIEKQSQTETAPATQEVVEEINNEYCG